MFFVKQEKIGTALGAQKEYSAASTRGIGFTNQGNTVWHYFWPADLLERSIREKFEPELREGESANAEDAEFGAESAHYNRAITHYIWSQQVGPGQVIGEPVINPYSGHGDWISEAKRLYEAEMARRAAAQAH